MSGAFIQRNDVSDAVRATQALRESEDRLRLLANSIPQMACVACPNGRQLDDLLDVARVSGMAQRRQGLA
ncbi:hypothetical protein [Janthinobacterium psychrotolerans]|uniref:hypothetical protein n=1 Tax=Janthinobacterium psychrotolerans TaxID=1747903 RepID=UPI0014961DD7|nr:hypothetical protein [Janthinobacterium psychrotolerans]